MEKAGHFWQPTAMAMGHSVIRILLSPLGQVGDSVWRIVRPKLRLYQPTAAGGSDDDPPHAACTAASKRMKLPPISLATSSSARPRLRSPAT